MSVELSLAQVVALIADEGAQDICDDADDALDLAGSVVVVVLAKDQQFVQTSP